ncbi:MAG: 50S ribosomal protein L1 [Anaerolineae bacterium]|nr:50S ribosomal protein L1 [Anaerolineae bacterium]
MAQHGKRYLDSVSSLEEDKLYPPQEALNLVKSMSKVKFDETVDVHMRLGIDPRHAEQQIRGVVVMPSGLGKQVRVAVFAEGDAERIARDAGADIVGSDELIQQIEKDGFLEFDVAIAIPEMMRKIGRLGKVLGTRGLMPNPKAGTVVAPEDLPRVIEEARAGRVEYRNDRTGNMHVPIGKVSFTVEQLMANFSTLMDAVRRARPASAKGTYVRKLVVTATMGPRVQVEPNEALALTAPD